MKIAIRRLLNQCGLDIVKYSSNGRENVFFPDLTAEEKEICKTVAPFTMTSLERIVSLIQAVRYISECGIPGDFVECGVWRGGSMMAVAYVLNKLRDTSRQLYLYDTFAGMSPPTTRDKRWDGIVADKLLNDSRTRSQFWCYADKSEVASNIFSTGYPKKNIHLVEGKVEVTLPQVLPERISLLRLDTDWYESTKYELMHLYPRVVRRGILIIDDYGYWKGSKEATDEYFSNIEEKPFLHRIDSTGRLAVKL